MRGIKINGKWQALYLDRNGALTAAKDALGRPINCDSEELAISVARYRRERLVPWRGI